MESLERKYDCATFLIRTYRYFIHQSLDLVHHLVSVGLVDVGREGNLPLPVLRYWSNAEHLAGGKLTIFLPKTAVQCPLRERNVTNSNQNHPTSLFAF